MTGEAGPYPCGGLALSVRSSDAPSTHGHVVQHCVVPSSPNALQGFTSSEVVLGRHRTSRHLLLQSTSASKGAWHQDLTNVLQTWPRYWVPAGATGLEELCSGCMHDSIVVMTVSPWHQCFESRRWSWCRIKAPIPYMLSCAVMHIWLNAFRRS